MLGKAGVRMRIKPASTTKSRGKGVDLRRQRGVEIFAAGKVL